MHVRFLTVSLTCLEPKVNCTIYLSQKNTIEHISNNINTHKLLCPINECCARGSPPLATICTRLLLRPLQFVEYHLAPDDVADLELVLRGYRRFDEDVPLAKYRPHHRISLVRRAVAELRLHLALVEHVPVKTLLRGHVSVHAPQPASRLLPAQLASLELVLQTAYLVGNN